jgi:hypothetical protein
LLENKNQVFPANLEKWTDKANVLNFISISADNEQAFSISIRYLMTLRIPIILINLIILIRIVSFDFHISDLMFIAFKGNQINKLIDILGSLAKYTKK